MLHWTLTTGENNIHGIYWIFNKGVIAKDWKHKRFQVHVKFTLAWRGSACSGC